MRPPQWDRDRPLLERLIATNACEGFKGANGEVVYALANPDGREAREVIEGLGGALTAIADESKGTDAWNSIPLVKRMREVAREACAKYLGEQS